MIARKKALYMTVPFLMTAASGVHADEAQTSSDYLTIGAGGRYAPRYSGSDKQVWQGVPVLQGRKGAFFIDAQKGIGYDLQNDSGVYLEHTLGYDLGRADENASWREGANNLKGMGGIDTSLNTGLAVGWQITSWLSVEGKATLPVTDSQGVNYQASVTLIPLQNSQDTIVFQSASLFGDSRYMNTWYGVSQQQSLRAGYSRYSAPGGFYGIDNSLTWSHQLDAHWGTLLSADYTWLGEHANNSPIVSRRQEGAVTAAITWTF
ncbi:TPA: MipA/OmpV family protein [Enterobacter cloacae]|uniref:MipA/OmpV family protein n=1 Tax=Enterobacter cloacae TaxID=550 RepID=UPI0007B3EDFA|nr:MipA/OmpV family protein [Enterobacter cloacae]KZP68642.1 MltA-interacting MipA family protein [Enterobacter cloacae subsp. dissolvens]VAM35576.1 mipA family protein [Enterobacter cloacae]HCR2029981.1 MipA/OmpV family protein [Enterobacter cloacae]